MSIENKLISQVDLKINADWNRVHKIYSFLVKKKNDGCFPSSPESAYRAEIYSLGQYGHITTNTSLTGGDIKWDVWGGKMLESLLPKEILDFKTELVAAGLNFINFDYFEHSCNILEHIDGKRAGEGINGQCNINYIVRTGADAVTFAHDGDHHESYQSKAETCWLLNTGVPHRIDNASTRAVLQIRIFSPFNDIKNFLYKKGMLV